MTTSEFMTFCDEIVPVQKFEKKPIYDVQIKSVKDPLSDDTLEQMSYKEVLDLRSGFIYLSIVDEENEAKYKEYFYLLEHITEHFNASVAKIASWSAPVWKDVIRFIKQFPEFPRTNAFYLEEFRYQERERARAAVRLRKYGISVKVEDNDLILGNLDNLIEVINNLAKSIGGKSGIKLMLENLDYRQEIGRYLIPHQGNLPSTSMIELEIPYGFLLNIFVKYISIDSSSPNKNKHYKQLVSISTDFCLAKYNSQKFNLWHDVFRPANDIVSLIHELVIRFDIYNLQQSGVTYTIEWCRFVIKQIKRDNKNQPLLNQYLDCFEKNMNWYVKQSSLSECVILRKVKGKRVPVIPIDLQQYLITNASAINQQFNYPVDFHHVNYMMHPLYESDGKYILLPKTLGIWNWYEALYSIIKHYNGELAKKIGLYMEDFIRNKMATHGIITHAGKYKYDSVEGEVDVLSQAKDGDIIFECKKKALSRNALKGDDFFIWSELYDMLYSQMQCARMENGVRNFSPLIVSDTKNNNSFSYIWIPKTKSKEGFDKERIVAKVTLTLKEYGPMQDMILISNILKNLSSKHISASFPKGVYNQREIDDFNKYFDKINETLDEMHNYYVKIGTKDPTFHCRFLSMEQLYLLIRKSSSNDELLKLVAQNYVSTGTENFWNEILNTSLSRKA